MTITGGFFAQTSTVTVTNSVLETTVIGTGQGTVTVPANTFVVGGSYRVSGGGKITCLNNAELTMRVYGGPAGATLLGQIPTIVIPTSSGTWWGIEIYMTVRAIGAATVASISARAVYQQNVDSQNGLIGQSFHVLNITDFDTTVNNTFNLTAQWGGIATLSNRMECAQIVLYKVY
jgi:hypothetical protein